MFEIIKNVINNTNYKLEEMLYKINKMYMESMISEAEKTELDSLARQNANAVNSYSSVEDRIENIYKELTDVKSRLNKLENKEETEPIEEYPEFIQPTGSHDAYKNGDKITFNNKKYICKMDNCVWSPETYPGAWEEVIKTTEEVVESEE